MVLTGGAVTRRQGSYYIAAPKANARVRLVDWRIGTDVTYQLEFGNLYVRFYRDRGRLVDGGAAPLEIATPYTTDQLRALVFAGSADVLTIFHGSHQPRQLSRTAANVFSLALLEFINGPYDAENTGDVPAAPTAPTSSSTETAAVEPTVTGSGSGYGGDATGSGEGAGGTEGEAGGGETGGDPGGSGNGPA
ncbi:MAG: hypothetical protein ACKVQR_04385 [Aquabacterium sp.]